VKDLATDIGQHLLNTIGQCLDMGPGSPRPDHKRIGDGDELPHLQQHDILTLLICDGVGCQPDCRNRVVYGSNLLVIDPTLRIERLTH
jgi:hypothetical protein